MPLQPIPGFLNGSYPARWRGVSATRTVNMRLELNEDPGAKSQYTLYPRPGKKLFATLPTEPIIGMWSNGFRVFVVAGPTSGATLYEVFQDGTNKAYGIVANDGQNPATMRANGTQLGICSGGNFYIATGTSVYQPIVNYGSGQCQIVGKIVTWLSGDQFQASTGDIPGAQINPGDLFAVYDKVYHVASIQSETQLTLVEDAGNQPSVPFYVGTEYVTGVMVEYIDGYFVVNVPETKTFRISYPLDGTIWDTLDFQTKSGSVDNIAAIISAHGYLVLLGESCQTEVWGDSGNAQFPFSRVSGMTQETGIAAPWAVCKFTDGSVAWLVQAQGGQHQIVLSTGYWPQRISNHALEASMAKYGVVDDAIFTQYLENGHEYLRVDFPTANRTWEWDKTNPAWYEVGISTQQEEVFAADLGRYRAHVVWPSHISMNLVGDYTSGKIWQTGLDLTDDDGTPIPVMRIAPHINTNLERSVSPAFALDCELGTVDPSLRGPDGKPIIPTVSLAYSDDGGYNWTEGGAASLGRAGEYQGTVLTPDEQSDTNPLSQTNPQTFEARPLWSSLGSFYIARTYKIKSTARFLRAVFNGLSGATDQ